jgi:outer membrane protein insertion porin family
MPLGLPKEFGLAGHAFTDFGSAFKVDSSGPTIVDSRKIRASVGYGFAWASPMGPLRIDFALPVLKQAYDKKEFFRIGFGSNF